MGKSAVDKAIYEGWVRDHARELYSCALRLAGNAALAEDLTQETFYEAWRSMSQLQEPHRARAWLFQILRHRYLHHVRDSGRRPQFSDTYTGEGSPVPSLDDHPDRVPAADAQVAEAEDLQAALNQLAPDCRVVLVMVLLEGRTCQETADDLKIPLGTVLSRLHRARSRLKAWFEREARRAGLHSVPAPGIAGQGGVRGG
jgi:RNA polymerase sigma-70 factor (ECF subfamily)